MIASTEAAKHSVREHGFAVLERHLDTETLTQTLCWHDEVIAKIDPRDIGHSVSGSNTRAHLPAHNPNLGHLYLDPALLAIAEGVLDAPFRLSGFLSRTVHPGAGDQPLHVDMARSSDGPSLLGFIYMLDEFRQDNGATRLVPDSHREASACVEVYAIAPAGSLLVYDTSTLHGFSANTSKCDRRSIQGTFILRSSPQAVERPWQLGRSDLARYLLGGPAVAEIQTSPVTP